MNETAYTRQQEIERLNIEIKINNMKLELLKTYHADTSGFPKLKRTYKYRNNAHKNLGFYFGA